MTLRLEKAGKVVAVLLSEPFRGAPDSIDLSLLDREKGLLLRSVRLTCENHIGGRRGASLLWENSSSLR
jgi:lipid-binding SYLF domain-containing protein